MDLVYLKWIVKITIRILITITITNVLLATGLMKH